MAGVAKEGFNMYYPPEWRPEHGDLDKFHGGHKLGNQDCYLYPCNKSN